jgi:hypothetical protein
MQRVCRREVVDVIRGHIYVWDLCKMGIEDQVLEPSQHIAAKILTKGKLVA